MINPNQAFEVFQRWEDSGILSAYALAVGSNVYDLYKQKLIDFKTAVSLLNDTYIRNPGYPDEPLSPTLA